MRDYRLYLKDIVAAMDSIQSFVQGMDLEALRADDRTASAVVRKLEIIGEAAKGVPERVRQRYPHIPWKEMAGMRDRLIHFYFEVEYELVFNTIRERLPHLKRCIEEILETNA